MKDFITIIAISFVLYIMFSSCSREQSNMPTYKMGVFMYGKDELKVLVIDSCEYLWGDWGSSTVLTHKGNCKYCAQRHSKQYEVQP